MGKRLTTAATAAKIPSAAQSGRRRSSSLARGGWSGRDDGGLKQLIRGKESLAPGRGSHKSREEVVVSSAVVVRVVPVCVYCSEVEGEGQQ